MKKRLLVYVIFCLPTMAKAQMRMNAKIGDFYYNFNSSDKTASVTYQGTFTEEYHQGGLWPEDNLPTFILSANYSGDVVIPKEVTCNDGTYTVTSIGDNAFIYCSGVTSVTIPNSITSIGNNAFVDCSSLTSVRIEDLKAWCEITFNDNPLRIAQHLYLNGVEVKDLVFPSGMTSISNGAFAGCSGLTSVFIPNSMTSIGNGAFNGCSGLASINVDSDNPIYDSRNNSNAIIATDNQLIAGCKNTVIPQSVTSIGSSAFSGCSGLSSITIPNSVTSIGKYAFFGCSGLSSLNIPSNIKSVEERTFDGCSGLTSIRIPNSVTSIGEYAFANCSGLVYIILPCNLNSIGEYAFWWCNSITDVYCEADIIPSTKEHVISDSEKIILHIPSGSLENYKSTEPWNKFEEYVALSTKDLQATEKCSKPTISIVDGKIAFSCETTGVAFRWSISSPEGTNGRYARDYGNWISLPITFNVYATKSGYQNSDVATYVFSGLNGDLDGNGVVNVADHVKLTEIIMKPCFFY